MAKPSNRRVLPLEKGKMYKVTYKRPDQRRMREFIGEFSVETDTELIFNIGPRPTGLQPWWIVQCVQVPDGTKPMSDRTW